MQPEQRHLDQLQKLAHNEGGWPYRPGGQPQVEPTCLALLACANAEASGAAEFCAAGIKALSSWQDADGAWRVRAGRPESVWPTALALFTLAALDKDADARACAARWLLETKGQMLDDPAAYKRDFDIDPDILGWPWTEGTFSWTEPTSWACMALRKAGFGDHQRVVDGLRMLRDRTFTTGGVNSGNRLVFGRPTEPVPTMSALVLLAHTGLPDDPTLHVTRTYLLKVAAQSDDLEHLCWIRLALEAWKHETPIGHAILALEQRIIAAYDQRQETSFFPESIVREALAALALSPAAETVFGAATSGDGIVTGAVSRQRTSLKERLQSKIRGWGVLALNQLRADAPMARVHVAPVADYQQEIAKTLSEQFAHFREQLPLKGKRVVLKPNLVEYHRDRVINTHPAFIAAVIELCHREGAAEVIVAEGPGHWRNTEYLVTASGLGDVLRHYKTRFIDLNHDDPVKTPNLAQLTRLEYLYLADTIAHADVVISLPKLKTHHWAGVTLSLKNLFGTMPGICYGWPKNELHWRGIENSIVDIAMTRTPDLAIVDGLVGMEGDGPLNGTPVPLGVVVMGTDLVAVDATCCRLMELDPTKIGHLKLGYLKKLGQVEEAKIEQLGEVLAQRSQPFETIPRFSNLRAASRTVTRTA